MDSHCPRPGLTAPRPASCLLIHVPSCLHPFPYLRSPGVSGLRHRLSFPCDPGIPVTTVRLTGGAWGRRRCHQPLRMGRGWASPEGACSSQQCSPAPPPFPSLSSPLPCLEHASSPPPCPLLATWKNTPGWNSVLEPPACKTWWGEEGSQLRAQPGKQPTGWEACRAARSLHKARQW